MTSKSRPDFVDRWANSHFDPYQEVKDKARAQKAASIKAERKMWQEMMARRKERNPDRIQYESKAPVTLPTLKWGKND